MRHHQGSSLCPAAPDPSWRHLTNTCHEPAAHAGLRAASWGELTKRPVQQLAGRYEARAQRQRKLGKHGDLTPQQAEDLRATLMLRAVVGDWVGGWAVRRGRAMAGAAVCRAVCRAGAGLPAVRDGLGVAALTRTHPSSEGQGRNERAGVGQHPPHWFE